MTRIGTFSYLRKARSPHSGKPEKSRYLWDGSRVVALILILCCHTPDTAAEQEIVGRDIAADIAKVISEHDVPGMAALITSATETIASGVAGKRARGRPEEIQIGDRFHIGSITKAMTATLCAILVQEQKLRWTTTVSEAFPELESSIQPEHRSTTVEQLLTQRSGFETHVLGDPKIMQLLSSHEVKSARNPVLARRECVKFILNQRTRSPTNRFVYSNANYVMVGHIVETVTQVPWEQLIQAKLFGPLEMRTAGFGAPGEADEFTQPRGHMGKGAAISPKDPQADNPPLYGPSGTVHCSILDCARFARLHLTRGRSQPGLLESEFFELLQTPLKTQEDFDLENVAPGSEGYAMGWYVFPDGVLTHSGTNLRWHALMAIIPKHRFAVMAVCNEGGEAAENACVEMIQTLIAAHMESPSERSNCR